MTFASYAEMNSCPEQPGKGVLRFIEILRRLLFLVALQVIIACAATNNCLAKSPPDDVVVVQAKTLSNRETVFMLSSHRTIETTVTFRCGSTINLHSSNPLPYTFVVSAPCSNKELIRFRKETEGRKWGYGRWDFDFKFGAKSSAKTANYIYALPYSDKEKHCLIQSYFGTFSHKKGFWGQYSLDFEMPEGTKVEASREGTVIAYRSDSNRGGITSDFAAYENYVDIKHNDGTYALYSHLKETGVLVKLGQHVKVGDVLGLSGSTGWANCPHLHFSVYRVHDGVVAESIPIRLKKNGVLIKDLIEGHSY